MELTRRFVFRGNACALAGQIFRPKTLGVDLDGASSLGVSGGRSQSQIKGRSFGDAITFASAFTFAEGLFNDEKQARDVTNHKKRQVDLETTTKVTAEVRELRIGQNPAFSAKRIRGTLVSRTTIGSGELSISPERDTVIQGVAIGGFGLEVTLNLSLFQKHDTRSKIVAAADDTKFVRSYGNHLVTSATVDGQHPTGRPGLIARDGIIYSTIVKEINWEGKPFPGAKIDGHSVIVPELGTLFFGELLIGGAERRLTMVRFELGSEFGGYVDSVDVGSNGGYFP